MALKVAENSLFAILARSSWWYSVAVGLVVIAISAVIANAKYLALGVFVALPFFGIACYAAYKQLQRPSAKRIIAISEQARSMSASEVAAKIAVCYKNERFESNNHKGKQAELELTRGFRKILLCSKRFKAANTGIEPLRQLVTAGDKAEATGYLYVTLGEISANAREFAKQNNIELVQADRLAAYFDGQVKIE